MTWWLWVPYPVQANFLSGVFSSLTFVKAFEESSRCHWIQGCVSAVVRKQGHTPGNITDLNDMTLAVNPFPNDKFETLPNWESFQTTILNFDETGKKLSKRVENTVGKGEIAHYEQCLLFPQFPTVFSKDLYCRQVKTRRCLGKG